MATIVIFDRIRENLASAGKKTDLETLVNASITQTLTRSIYTSLTTFIMVFLLFIMGVSSIREFALPLMVGIVCRRILFCMYYRRSLVCHEEKI